MSILKSVFDTMAFCHINLELRFMPFKPDQCKCDVFTPAILFFRKTRNLFIYIFRFVCFCVINQERPTGSEGGAHGGEIQATGAAGQWGINEGHTAHLLRCLYATDFFSFCPLRSRRKCTV